MEQPVRISTLHRSPPIQSLMTALLHVAHVHYPKGENVSEPRQYQTLVVFCVCCCVVRSLMPRRSKNSSILSYWVLLCGAGPTIFAQHSHITQLSPDPKALCSYRPPLHLEDARSSPNSPLIVSSIFCLASAVLNPPHSRLLDNISFRSLCLS